jgi:hypothetical protein
METQGALVESESRMLLKLSVASGVAGLVVSGGIFAFCMPEVPASDDELERFAFAILTLVWFYRGLLALVIGTGIGTLVAIGSVFVEKASLGRLIAALANGVVFAVLSVLWLLRL